MVIQRMLTRMLTRTCILILFMHAPRGGAENVHGVLRVVKGEVQIKSAKTGLTVRARLGEQVFAADVIITGKDSRAKVVMIDNNEINVSPDSKIEIKSYRYDPAAGKKDVLLNVIYGKVRAKVEQKYDGTSAKFEIHTPAAVAGVRGTDFLTTYDPVSKTSEVVAFRGQVEFGTIDANGAIAKSVMVIPGQQASSVSGAPPAAAVSVPKNTLLKIDKESIAANAPAPVTTAATTSTNSSGRAPAASPAPASTLRNEDFAGSDNRPASPLTPVTTGSETPLPPVSTIVKAPALPVCDICNQAIQSGNSRVLIHVNTNN